MRACHVPPVHTTTAPGLCSVRELSLPFHPWRLGEARCREGMGRWMVVLVHGKPRQRRAEERRGPRGDVVLGLPPCLSPRVRARVMGGRPAPARRSLGSAAKTKSMPLLPVSEKRGQGGREHGEPRSSQQTTVPYFLSAALFSLRPFFSCKCCMLYGTSSVPGSVCCLNFLKQLLSLQN